MMLSLENNRMFKVLEESELPPKFSFSKYPLLEIGQGFEIAQEHFSKDIRRTRCLVYSAYKWRKQKVSTMQSPNGSLFVKRIK